MGVDDDPVVYPGSLEGHHTHDEQPPGRYRLTILDALPLAAAEWEAMQARARRAHGDIPSED